MKTKFMTAQPELTPSFQISYPFGYRLSHGFPPPNTLASKIFKDKLRTHHDHEPADLQSGPPQTRLLSDYCTFAHFEHQPSTSNHAQSRPVTLNFCDGSSSSHGLLPSWFPHKIRVQPSPTKSNQIQPKNRGGPHQPVHPLFHHSLPPMHFSCNICSALLLRRVYE